MKIDRIALVGCGKDKQEEPAEAGELYTSGFFGLKADWATEHTDSWWVLSAEHALLHHTVRTHPYDTTVSDPDFDQNAWRDRVGSDLNHVIQMADPNEIVLLAGGSYLDPIRDVLDAVPPEITTPLSGMGIGEQQAWLSDRV